MEQYRSSLAEIESNILVGDIDDELLSQQVKEKVIEKFKDAKEKLENSRKKIIELEQENLQYTKQSQEIALERFRLGTINSVELREAQLSLLNAENRLILAQIEAKNAETELLRLSGDLLRRVN